MLKKIKAKHRKVKKYKKILKVIKELFSYSFKGYM